MWIDKAQPDTVLHIAANMRQLDREEIFATRWNDDPQRLTDEILYLRGITWVLGDGDDPIMAFGAVPIHAGVWSVWMFATDDFYHIAQPATRFVKKVMKKVIVDTHAHRAQCQSLYSHHVAHKWLEHLGFHQESVLFDYGKNREDFYQYVWRKD